MGVNNLSDLTEAEYEAMLLPEDKQPGKGNGKPDNLLAETETEKGRCGVPEENYGTGKSDLLLDFRVPASNFANINAVTPVVDQGACGSCWCFNTVAAEESSNIIKNPHMGLLKFSEQQVLDCNP